MASSFTVLTWIHIYLLSHTQGTSSASTTIRIYFEIIHSDDLPKIGDPKYYNKNVPLGVSVFPKDLNVLPDRSVCSFSK